MKTTVILNHIFENIYQLINQYADEHGQVGPLAGHDGSEVKPDKNDDVVPPPEPLDFL